MPLLEKLVINGIDLRQDGVGSVPGGASCAVSPVWVSEVVTLLDGRQATFRAAQRGAVEVSVDGGEAFVISSAVKQQLEQALMTFSTVSLIETLSEPSEERHWSGFLTEFTPRELEGSDRELFLFKFKLRQEG